MSSKNNLSSLKKGLLLGFTSLTVLGSLLYFEIKKIKTIDNYNFQGDWICYDKKENLTNIMHLTIATSFIRENDVNKDGYEAFDKMDGNNFIGYEIFIKDKKYSDILEIDKNKMQYKNINANYECDRSSKVDHSLDFNGRWIGYLNKSKKDKISKSEMSKIKIVVDIKKDMLLIDLADNKDKYYEKKIKSFKQEYGLINLDVSSVEKQNNTFSFKILSNKEIILINSDISQKDTYLKRDELL